MKKTDLLRLSEYLAHMSEAVGRIQRYVDDLAEPAFLADSKTQDAVIRYFEILGEAARNIELHHPNFAAAHPEVPWSLIYTMRIRLAHGYFKVDYELLWKTIHAELPELQHCLSRLSPTLPNQG